MFCLSKGLGAPVGSMLCGSGEFVDQARRVRKRFGGGMRQVGVLAAAGLVALERMPGRLAQDHTTARLLAEGLREIDGITIPVIPETNILIFEVDSRWSCGRIPEEGHHAVDFTAQLKDNGILALALDRIKVRMVTHYDLPHNAVERTLEAVQRGK
jgi:threonine aldolase